MGDEKENKEVDPVSVALAISQIMALLFNIYQSAKQIEGKTPIPSWDEITNKNRLLQARIDAEMK